MNLNKAGLSTHAFVGPLFPHLWEQPQYVDELLGAISAIGTKEIYLAHLNPRFIYTNKSIPETSKQKFQTYMRKHAVNKPRLEAIALKLARQHGLTLRVSHFIDH